MGREYRLVAAVNGVTLELGLTLVAFVRHPLGQDGALVLRATDLVSIGLGSAIRFVAYRR